MTRAGLDLDGVFYDALDLCLDIDTTIRTNLGYPPTSKEDYTKHFQTKDWKKFYRDLGIKEKDLEKVIKSFYEELEKREPPSLIPGAKEAIEKIEKALGKENIYFVTNEPEYRIKKRFKRDNLLHLLPNARSSLEGKSRKLYEIAITDLSFPFNYIGDLVSDGEECLEAINKGAKNICFYGILHKYSFNPPEMIKSFVKQHPEFAKTLNNLQEVNKIWNP